MINGFTFINIAIFIFGTIIGSFLNVVIFRYNTGRSVNGRSFCFSCGKRLSWYELIPLMSFFIQGSRCRSCKSKISWQYPVVEFITGFVFVAIFLKTQQLFFDSSFLYLLYLVFTLFVFSILIIIAAYDIRHKIIPDKLVWLFIGLSLLSLFFVQGGLLIKVLAGPILALPFALLWFFSKGRLMGFGDAKIALGIGFLLGLSGGVAALILGFWMGAIISILLLMFSRLFARYFPFHALSRLNMKSEIPFGPFLIAGTFIVFLFDIDMIALIRLFQL